MVNWTAASIFFVACVTFLIGLGIATVSHTPFGKRLGGTILVVSGVVVFFSVINMIQ